VPDLDIAAVVRALNAHGVRYIVIGGVAAMVHNLPLPATVDIDVTPSRDGKNLECLATAFDALEAGLLTADEAGTWFPRHPVENWAQYDTLHLMTKHGLLDISSPDLRNGPFRLPTPEPSSSPSPCGSNSSRRRVAPRTSNTWTGSTRSRGHSLPAGENPGAGPRHRDGPRGPTARVPTGRFAWIPHEPPTR
jgi:hypothetical protein